jgi:hypothetical protein
LIRGLVVKCVDFLLQYRHFVQCINLFVDVIQPLPFFIGQAGVAWELGFIGRKLSK